MVPYFLLFLREAVTAPWLASSLIWFLQCLNIVIDIFCQFGLGYGLGIDAGYYLRVNICQLLISIQPFRFCGIGISKDFRYGRIFAVCSSMEFVTFLAASLSRSCSVATFIPDFPYMMSAAVRPASTVAIATYGLDNIVAFSSFWAFSVITKAW